MRSPALTLLMSIPHTQNHRSAERWPADTYASLSTSTCQGVKEGFGAVLDISRGGMRIRTPQPPVRFMKVLVRIAVAEQLFEIPCKCVRVLRGDGGNFDVGLSFDPLLPDAEAFLAAFAI